MGFKRKKDNEEKETNDLRPLKITPSSKTDTVSELGKKYKARFP